jgi:hypothetical protein
MSNGGQIAEVKSFSMDTHAKAAGLYNIETAKVLTYTSQNGSHLMGQESYVLDIAGNWSDGLDNIVCVFARAAANYIPAFCNKVTASSKLRQVTTAQIETVGSLTAVGRTANVPAALNYEISVTPDANSASGYADGIFTTVFTASIMEGRSDSGWTPMTATNRAWWAGYYQFAATQGWLPIEDNFPPFDGWDELGTTLTFIDTATAVGGVSAFNKEFSYQSGIYCEKCNL